MSYCIMTMKEFANDFFNSSLSFRYAFHKTQLKSEKDIIKAVDDNPAVEFYICTVKKRRPCIEKFNYRFRK